ncbi:elongation factor P hydroxylase [Lacimicrobium alkaliphilum]|uniref:Elongation factor P hydroxylase n=1 Tax=Lacimicrobium alkaliphilum TaxID=1526571 RepID=A0A0U2ZH26_9ALTE|nr:elongation factor P hydroxylase [Lacimicrobium alkaliphilum]ALS97708.1 elongation factor P hydroxylase [Lacimicrobium alkaliphilum]
MAVTHHYQDLIRLFDGQFAASHNTRLIKGDDEPVYLPADAAIPYHRIIFAHGFYASALHEIAHWCLAGPRRRLLEDYGYWYCPDGRNAEQQAEFEQVEIKPQAIEWAFCIASGKEFKVSTDNLNGVEPDRAAFTARVQAQALSYLESGFPERARQFIQALQRFYATPCIGVKDFISEDATRV